MALALASSVAACSPQGFCPSSQASCPATCLASSHPSVRVLMRVAMLSSSCSWNIFVQ